MPESRLDNSPSAFSPASARRRAVIVEQVVRIDTEFGPAPFIAQVEVPAGPVELAVWGAQNKAAVSRLLLRHGAILFRGFLVPCPQAFHEFVRGVCGDTLEYRERSSPRRLVREGVYTSTDYPASERIILHNENSYQSRWPQKIAFHCIQPAESGGETTLSEIRAVTSLIDPAVRRHFAERGVLYQRNYRPDIGISWQIAFQTQSPAEVDRYCRSAAIETQWISPEHLRTRQVRHALARHPSTGEELWFNHVAFFHVSSLPTSVRAILCAEFEPADLPNNVYYGDGSEIGDEVVSALRTAYEAASARFAWRAGDVLLLDNMLVAHGREPYSGQRQVVVSMAEAVSA